VIRLDSPVAYFNLVNDLAESNYITSVCFGVVANSGTVSAIPAMQKKLSMAIQSASVLLNFGYVTEGNYQTVIDSAMYLLQDQNLFSEFKHIIIASGSSPKDLTNYKEAVDPYIEQRYEWAFWTAIQEQHGGVEKLMYGDFGTKHPHFDPSAK